MSFPQLHLTQPHRKVNWGRLADANVDSITRRGDIHSVLSFADDVTYGEPGELDVHPTISTAFKLSQLTVQYLLHTQQVLSESGNQSDAQRAAAHSRLQQTKSALKLQKETMQHLKREHARQEELIESYRALLHTVNPKVARRADKKTGRAKKRRRGSTSAVKQARDDPVLEENEANDVELENETVQDFHNKNNNTEVEDEDEDEDDRGQNSLTETSDKNDEENDDINETLSDVVSDEAPSFQSRMPPNMLTGVPEVRSSLEIDDVIEDPIASMIHDRDEEKEVQDRQAAAAATQESERRRENKAKVEAEQQQRRELHAANERREKEQKKRKQEEKEKEKEEKRRQEVERERKVKEAEAAAMAAIAHARQLEEQRLKEEEKQREIALEKERERMREEREKQMQEEKKEREREQRIAREEKEHKEREQKIAQKIEAEKNEALSLFPGQYDNTTTGETKNNVVMTSRSTQRQIELKKKEDAALDLFPGHYNSGDATAAAATTTVSDHDPSTNKTTRNYKMESDILVEENLDDYDEEDMLEMLDFNDSELSMTDPDISDVSINVNRSSYDTGRTAAVMQHPETTAVVPTSTPDKDDAVQPFSVGDGDDDDDSDAVQAFEDDFESDDEEDQWKREKEKEIEDRKRKHELEQKAKREAEQKMSATTSIKPADQRKYSKAFEKWCGGDDELSIDNIKDLFRSLRGKLKLELTDDELKPLLLRMGVKAVDDSTSTISLEDFMKGVAARQELVGR